MISDCTKTQQMQSGHSGNTMMSSAKRNKITLKAAMLNKSRTTIAVKCVKLPGSTT